MSKFSNKEAFKDNKEVYALLTELDEACNSTDSLVALRVHVLLGKLKTHGITFEATKEIETSVKKDLTETEISSTIN